MKKLLTIVCSLLCLAISAAFAQTSVTTSGGTTGKVPVFTGTSSVGNSAISQSGSNVGIGTTSPTQTLSVSGTAQTSGHIAVGNGAQIDALPGALTQYENGPGIITFKDTFTVAPGPNAGPSGLYGELAVNPTTDASTSTYFGMSVGIGTPLTSAQPIAGVEGAYIPTYLGGNNNVHDLTGLSTDTEAFGGYSVPSTVTNFTGLNSFNYVGPHYAATNLYQVQAQANIDGAVTNSYGYFLLSPWGQGTVTNNYGLYIQDQSGFGSVGSFNIYSAGTGKNYFSGKVGIGTTTPSSALEVNGGIKLTSGTGGSVTFADGSVQSTAWTGSLCGGDYAESVDVSGDRTHFEPGDVMVIDSANPGRFLKSAEPYSSLVSGIYSTKPGALGRRQTTPKSSDEVPMAMIGIVPTKVTTESGPINVGDLLVTSSTTGYAMKGTDPSRMTGRVLGKALGSLSSGTGVIEVLVTLQ